MWVKQYQWQGRNKYDVYCDESVMLNMDAEDLPDYVVEFLERAEALSATNLAGETVIIYQ